MDLTPFQGAIFDVDGVLVDSPHEKAWRESMRELMESDWSDIRDRTTWSPEAFTSPCVRNADVGQAAPGRRSRGARVFPRTRRRGGASPTSVRRAKAGDGRAADRGGRFHRVPGCTAIHHCRQGCGVAGGRRLLVEERRPVSAPDPTRYVRRGTGHLVGHASPGVDAARLLRRRRFRTGLRARKAGPGDVPHGGARDRRSAGALDCDGGRRRRCASGEGG